MIIYIDNAFPRVGYEMDKLARCDHCDQQAVLRQGYLPDCRYYCQDHAVMIVPAPASQEADDA